MSPDAEIWRILSGIPGEAQCPMIDVAPRSRYWATTCMPCLPGAMYAVVNMANSLAGVFSTWQPSVCNDLLRGALSVG